MAGAGTVRRSRRLREAPVLRAAAGVAPEDWRDWAGGLPENVLAGVFGRAFPLEHHGSRRWLRTLYPKDLARASCVCSRWNAAAEAIFRAQCQLPAYAPRAPRKLEASPETGITAESWSSTWQCIGPTKFFEDLRFEFYLDQEVAVWDPRYTGEPTPVVGVIAGTPRVRSSVSDDAYDYDPREITDEEWKRPAFRGFSLTLHHRWLTGSYLDKNREVARDVISTMSNNTGYFSVDDVLDFLSEHELKCKGGPVNWELGQGPSNATVFAALAEHGIWEEDRRDGRGTYCICCDS